MLAIISPAKKLKEKPSITINKYSFPEFINDADLLINELRQLSPSDLEVLMGINRNLAELNYERVMHWTAQQPENNAHQAIFMFNGHVYQTLDAKSLSESELSFAQNHLRILSGLYGALRPLDLIQPYRLEMGTKLNNNRGKNLYKFWGDKINTHINELLRNQKTKTLINLASQEYFKAIKPELIDGTIITPIFKERKGDEYKTVAIYAKQARGEMTRFILEEKAEEPEILKTFEKDGYVYNEKLSTDTEWVFTR
jgi:hypothetical protein